MKTQIKLMRNIRNKLNTYMNNIHFNKLEYLYDTAAYISLKNNNKFVIFSDLHLGDGGRNDDFKKNGPLFQSVLEEYYLKHNYTLILNGDIEELQRFSLKSIKKRWKNLYYLFDSFQKNNRFYKLYGNHDDKYLLDRVEYDYPVKNSIIINYKNTRIFVIHGHQPSIYFTQFNWFAGFWLKYFANLMGIKNFPVPFHSTIKYLTEKRAYEYAKYKRIISIMGHTHRPLFESLSKLDHLKYLVEEYCREFLYQPLQWVSATICLTGTMTIQTFFIKF